jgi:hypothetical protein
MLADRLRITGGGPIILIDDGSAGSGAVMSDTATITGLSSTGPHTIILITGGVDSDAIAINSVTFGGNAATALTSFVIDSANQAFVQIWYIAGAQTGDIVVTLGGSSQWAASATIVSLINLLSSTAVDTDTAESNLATSLSLSALASPGAGGIRLVVFSHDVDGEAITPTNATEIDDEDLSSNTRHWTGYDLGDDGTTITCANAGTANNCAMAGVSLR